MDTSNVIPAFPGFLERGEPPAELEFAPSDWGFGGVHGGLLVGLLLARLEALIPGRPLLSARARLLAPVRGAGSFSVTPPHEGRTLTRASVALMSDGRVAATCDAAYRAPASPIARPIEPVAPEAPPPSACPVFHIPPTFVPFSTNTEVRPIGERRPFSGADEPELLAWIRLVNDDHAPDVLRLAILMDCLAPSYGALLHAPAPIPTVEMTLRPTTRRATSCWVLVRARTHMASAEGWIEEHLDLWDERGNYLGSGEQLRHLRLGREVAR